jgi:hypothetical protein
VLRPRTSFLAEPIRRCQHGGVRLREAPMARMTSCIAGAWPRISGSALFLSRTTLCIDSSIARRISSSAYRRRRAGQLLVGANLKSRTAISRSELLS